jgi:hypothetical protein
MVIEVLSVFQKHLPHAGFLHLYFNNVHDYQHMFSPHLFRDKQNTGVHTAILVLQRKPLKIHEF